MKELFIFLISDYFAGLIYALTAGLFVLLILAGIVKYRGAIRRFFGGIKHNARIRAKNRKSRKIARLRAEKKRVSDRLCKLTGGEAPADREPRKPERPAPTERTAPPTEESLQNIYSLLGRAG